MQSPVERKMNAGEGQEKHENVMTKSVAAAIANPLRKTQRTSL
jgi:hypothetical protein